MSCLRTQRSACADPGIFVGGRGGGGGRLRSDNVFLFFFFCPQLGQFIEIYHFSKFQRGSNIFQGGGGSNFFQKGGGVQLLIPCRDPYTL